MGQTTWDLYQDSLSRKIEEEQVLQENLRMINCCMQSHTVKMSHSRSRPFDRFRFSFFTGSPFFYHNSVSSYTSANIIIPPHTIGASQQRIISRFS